MPRRAKKNARRRRAYRLLVAPQGFEPRSSESESLVLPLNEGAPDDAAIAGAKRTDATAGCLIECTGVDAAGQRQWASGYSTGSFAL